MRGCEATVDTDGGSTCAASRLLEQNLQFCWRRRKGGGRLPTSSHARCGLQPRKPRHGAARRATLESYCGFAQRRRAYDATPYDIIVAANSYDTIMTAKPYYIIAKPYGSILTWLGAARFRCAALISHDRARGIGLAFCADIAFDAALIQCT